MKKLLASICITMAVITTAAMAKDAPTVKATVDKKAIYIGDRIRYEVEVASKDPVDIEFPAFPDYKIGDFEIKDSGKTERKGFFGGRYISRWYSITTYFIGKRAIPEAEVKYRPKGAKDWAALKTKPIEITVESVLPKEKKITDIRDIKGPIGFREPYWIIALCVGLVLAIIAFIIYRRIAGRKPVRLPHETALEELEAIAAYLTRTGDIKGYYVQASDTVRRYIERSFSLKAPEMTTEEFLDSVKDAKALRLEHKDMLKSFLSACDLVKFAKYTPAKTEIEAVLAAARKFIEETKEVNDVHV